MKEIQPPSESNCTDGSPSTEEEVTVEEMTPQPSEDSNSGEFYEAQSDDMPVSAGDIKIAIRVACVSEAFLGRCFRCNKVRHHFRNEECKMYNPDFLNSAQGPAKTSLDQQVPRAKNAWGQADQGQDEPVGDIYPKPNVLNQREEDEGEGMSAREAHALPFPKRPKTPSPTDFPAQKKHNAVPSQLLNADPLAQIIGMETVADVIIGNAEACALLDSGATADLMSSAYGDARGFYVRPITELRDRYVNVNLALGYSSPVTGFKYNLRMRGISSYDSNQVALLAKDDTQFSKEVSLTIGTKTEDPSSKP